MLYSCLVDADFLDTETFMRGEAADRGNYESLNALNQKPDDGDANRKKLAAETCDAPIIVSTSDQLFESFYANRPYGKG